MHKEIVSSLWMSLVPLVNVFISMDMVGGLIHMTGFSRMASVFEFLFRVLQAAYLMRLRTHGCIV